MAIPNPERELARLEKALRPAPPPLILISGPSGFFRNEALEIALGAVPAAADLRRIDGGEKTDGSELLDLRGGSLFGSGSWLCVRRGEAWLKEHGAELAEVLPRIAKGCGLLLEVGKVDKRTRLAKELLAVGLCLEFRDLYAEPYDRSRSPLEAELVAWVVQRARKVGLSLTQEAAFAIVSTVGREPAELAAELVRLREVAPTGRPLTPDDLRAHLTVSFESTPFEFADAVLAHDRPRAERSLDAMFARGVKGRDGAGMDAGGVFPFVTSWLWQSLSSVQHGRALCDDGVRLDEVAARAGVRTFADRFRAQVEANPEPRLRRGLLLCLDAQRELRTTGEEPREVLGRFLSRYFREGVA